MTRTILNACRFVLHAIPALALCVAPCAFATEDLITLDIGGYRFNARNDVVVGGPTVAGREFRVERVGAPENDTVARVDGTLRFFERHRIRFMYLNSSREGSASLDRDLVFRTVVIPAGTSLTAGFGTRQAELDYMYSFYKTAATELALSLGIHATRLEISLNSPQLNVSGVATASGPLPMIGVAGTTRLGQNWELLGHVYGMKAKVGDYDGSALAYRVGGRYYITPNLGVGVAWAGINYNLDVNRTSWVGSLDASNQGGEAFLTLRF